MNKTNSTQSDCIFCKIVAKEIPANVVYETPDVLAFLDLKPINPGHTLVVPKAHSEGIADISEKDLHAVISTVQKISQALKSTIRPDGINIGQNNGKSAGQIIFHTHFHVIPRFDTDGLKAWHRENPDISKQEDIAKTLSSALKG